MLLVRCQPNVTKSNNFAFQEGFRGDILNSTAPEESSERRRAKHLEIAEKMGCFKLRCHWLVNGFIIFSRKCSLVLYKDVQNKTMALKGRNAAVRPKPNVKTDMELNPNPQQVQPIPGESKPQRTFRLILTSLQFLLR
ncbi:hypothetical protein RUM43_004675 [Polyplax serrata]|uniref:Uncharacterized protein n=1 Tax=Polyplax serrata TaxID=468196 RepID=A0AAN8SB81_POLSC